MPGALRQTWYCSVSLRWKRSLGVPFGRAGLRSASPGPGVRSVESFGEQRDELVVADVPGCRQDDLLPLVRAAVVAGERAP